MDFLENKEMGSVFRNMNLSGQSVVCEMHCLRMIDFVWRIFWQAGSKGRQQKIYTDDGKEDLMSF